MSGYIASIVGNLTDRQVRRHEFVTNGVAILLVVVLMSFGASAGAASQQWQSTEQIAATAEQFLRERIGRTASRTTVKAGRLDSRHRLSLCSQQLEPFLRRGTEISARTIVGVRCNGEKPWKIYVPVEVVVNADVLVASRTLPRGHLITAGDLVAQPRDVSRLISGYLSDVERLKGQRLKTQLIAGRILTPSMLQADATIRRGQAVTLIINSGGINVQMSGKALMDGALNQRIKVENNNSGRVVEGIVRSPEHVEVLVANAGHFFNAKPKVSPPLADMRSSSNDR